MTTPDVPEKWCSGCDQYVALSEFHKSRNAVDGLQWRCKECMRAYNREHRRIPRPKKAVPFSDVLVKDMTTKVDAGAQLIYALYHMGGEWWKRELTRGFWRAYENACAAYGLDASLNKKRSQDDDDT